MQVFELIAALQRVPANLEVVIDGSALGFGYDATIDSLQYFNNINYVSLIMGKGFEEFEEETWHGSV